MSVVLGQAFLLALFGFVPATALGWWLYELIGQFSSLRMQLTAELILLVLGLTTVMCLFSGMMAVRKVVAADPADVF